MKNSLNGKQNRREFIKLALLTTFSLSLGGCRHIFESGQREPPVPEGKKHPEIKKPKEKEEPVIDHRLPRRKLGRTGMELSIFSLGGAFTVARNRLPEESEALINRALDLGVNFIDTAPTYGSSEYNIGRVMKYRRNDTYLASKTLDRTYDGTMRLFEQSLQRLKTDYLDLYLVHALHSEEDLKTAAGPGGCFKALEELKGSGTVKHTGTTAHKNYHLILQAINEYNCECLLLALNPAEINQDLKNLLEKTKSKDIGVLAMKVAAYGRLFRKGGVETMEEALGYALSTPASSAVVGISTLNELEENIHIARTFKPLIPEEISRLESLAQTYRNDITFYKNW